MGGRGKDETVSTKRALSATTEYHFPDARSVDPPECGTTVPCPLERLSAGKRPRDKRTAQSNTSRRSIDTALTGNDRSYSTHLLHHATRLELVTVGQAAHKAALAQPVDTETAGFILGPAERRICPLLEFDSVGRILLLLLLLLFDNIRVAICASTAMASPPLLRLAVQEEVAKDTTRAPEESVGPTLDTTLVLVENKHGARGDHLAFGVDKAAGDPGYESATSSFQDKQCISRRLYPPRPRRLGPCTRGVLGRVGRRWMGIVGHVGEVRGTS